jgi:Protein of unknown function (DUF3562)
MGSQMSHAIEPKTTSAEAAIHSLASETETSTDLVRSLYEEEFSNLNEQATVKQFVSVIATRLVRRRLRALSVAH